MKLTDLRSLFVHELKDLLHTELQLMQTLPKWSSAASSERLRSAIAHHYEQTKGHADRLERILRAMGETAHPERCRAMQGIIAEAEDLLSDRSESESSVFDAALICSAQRVEHYEIAAYGCLRNFARAIGNVDAADELQHTLDEEHAADRTFTLIAETQVNRLASGLPGDGDR